MYVIQRRVSGRTDDISNGEGDIAEAKGLGAACATAWSVFDGAEEPVEGNNGEVAYMAVDGSVSRVLGPEDFPEVARTIGTLAG